MFIYNLKLLPAACIRRFSARKKRRLETPNGSLSAATLAGRYDISRIPCSFISLL
jgi:hypothetical protein